jgi:hypothetical protein
MIPPSLLIEPPEAVQMTRTQFGCDELAAAAYLEDLIGGGALTPDWPDGAPDPVASFDWFAGVVSRGMILQDRAFDLGEEPTFRTYRRTWPFRLRRQELLEHLDPADPAVAARPEVPPRPRRLLDRTVRRMCEYREEHGGVDLRHIPSKEAEHLFGVSRDTIGRALREIYPDER